MAVRGTPKDPGDSKLGFEGVEHMLGRATRALASLPNMFLTASGPQNGRPGPAKGPQSSKSAAAVHFWW